MSEALRNTQGGEDRRLAAIVFTDVVAYSARVQRDEAGTLALVRADFHRMRTSAEQQGGQVMNTMGDGMLLCFASALQAVGWALQMQGEFGARRRAAPPGSVLEHRMGVHLGDVISQHGQIVGDGVNIAARLQGKAEPGGVCVSQITYESVKNRLPMRAVFLGPQTFKNLRDAIPVYALTAGGGAPDPREGRMDRRRWGLAAAGLLLLGAGVLLYFRPAPGTPAGPKAAPPPAAPERSVAARSLAVLPFANMSDDKESGYFADGVHEDILTDLASIPGLHVVSRTSVQRYRDTRKSMREIAAELGVVYILEGSVRRAGNTVRVTGQLIRAATDEHVWAKHYDRELKDVFQIQAALATEIAQALHAAISPEQQARLNQAATKVPAAYDLLLRARAVLYHNIETKKENYAQAETLLRAAVELDPEFAVAWSYLADVHALFYYQSFDRSEERRAMARAAIERAQQLAPDRVEVLRNYGAYLYHAWRDFARAGEYYRRALELQPNDGETHLLLAWQLRRSGQWPEALAHLRRAYELDPASVSARATYITTLGTGARHYDEAIRVIAAIAQREKNPLSPPRLGVPMMRFFATGSTRELSDYLDSLPPALKTETEYFERRRQLALFQGDWAAAYRLGEDQQLPWEDPLYKAALLAALDRKDEARREATAHLDDLQAQLQGASGEPRVLKGLAMTAAFLGKNELALSWLRQAQEMGDRTQDHMENADRHAVAAFVLLWTGDREGALRELALNFREPGVWAHNVHEVRHSPLWAALRGDPRFEAVLSDPKNNAPTF